MKKSFIAFCFIVSTSSIFAYDIASKVQLKTKAKTVTQTDFTIISRFGEYFRTPSEKYIYSYDSEGKMTESSALTPRDVLENRISYSYDALGNLVKQVCFDADGNQLWNTTTTFKDGNKTESSEFSKDKLNAKTIYTYTDNLLTDESYYNGEGTLIWKMIYKYNSNGKIEAEFEYNGEGTLDEERKYSYLDSGLIDSITYFDSLENETSKEIFRYSADKTLNEITTYDSDGNISKRTIVKNDSFGNVTRVTVYNVAQKFGTTVNEMTDMSEFVYDYNTVE